MEISYRTCLNKALKSIGIMYKSRNILNKQLMIKLYFSSIRYYLNFTNAS